jgi:sigma-B regulation protein RsbU (phosphoserine phosphatase)
MPDLEFEREGVVIMGDQVVQTMIAAGTDYGGFFSGHPSAKPFRTRAVLFFVVKNNQILHERRVYDFSGILLQRLEDELKTAAKIQQALQPVGRYGGVGFDVAAVSIPCRKIGGDFFDFFQPPDAAFGLVLGDVAGKGPPAALMAAMLLGLFGEHIHRGGNPAETFEYVNASLLRRAIEARFATALCAMLTADGRLTYCNAGHNHPFIVGKAGPRHLTKSGLVLGAFENVKFEKETVQLDPGDVLVIFSDGITEALSANEDEFGDDRLMSCVQAHRELEPMALLDHILEVVRQFTAGAVQSDDLTGLVLRYTGPPAATG